ncbi:MAG: enoyl-CoA hydratase/isomerase family protein, partial [Thermoanaerobaculia bacterium]
DRGRLGDKSGQGFYKKGGKSILSLDLKTREYRERIEPEIPSIGEAMKKHGVAVAPWVDEMLALEYDSFYRGDSYYDPARRGYVSIAPDPRAIDLASGRVVRENKGASLIDIGDRVLCLAFHTKMNTLDDDVRSMIVESVAELENGAWAGMVIGNEGADFCIGANLAGSFFSNGSEGIERAVKAMQDALMAVRFCAKPIVTAPFARTLAGGAEVAMAGARIVAASETYMGLVEVGVGLVPGAGGCKELVRRVVSPALRQTTNADPLPFVQKVLQTIGAAKVSTSAADARSLGFLDAADRIVMNRDHLIFEAKEEVLELAAHGYTPPVREKSCYAAGRDVRAALKAGIYQLQQGAYMSEYDALISSKLASILCGGDLSSGQWVDEQFFLDREREVFVELSREPKTRDRIQAMLSTGKPLRN